MSLHPVHGHAELRTTLATAHRAGTLPSALLLHGPRGVGKQRLALWIAQLDLCSSPSEMEPDCTCRSCRLAVRLEHPDIHWFFPLPRPKRAGSPEKMADALEAARFARIDDVRAAPLQPPAFETASGIYLAAARSLRKRAQSRPSMSPRQVFVIGDADRLVPQEASPEAANALLKLLEEPPADTRFVLTSSAPGALLDTIRSRTVPLLVRPLETGEVIDFLVATGVDVEAAETAARLGHGSIGRALGFLPDGDDPGPMETMRREAFDLLKAALSNHLSAGFEAGLARGVSGGRMLVPLLAELEIWMRDLAAVAAGHPDAVVNRDAVPWLTRKSRDLSIRPDVATRTLARVDEAALHARGNVNPQLLVAGLVADLQALLQGPRAQAGTPVKTHG